MPIEHQIEYTNESCITTRQDYVHLSDAVNSCRGLHMRPIDGVWGAHLNRNGGSQASGKAFTKMQAKFNCKYGAQALLKEGKSNESLPHVNVVRKASNGRGARRPMPTRHWGDKGRPRANGHGGARVGDWCPCGLRHHLRNNQIPLTPYARDVAFFLLTPPTGNERHTDVSDSLTVSSPSAGFHMSASCSSC
jgi:hypothetical protein